MRRGLAAVQEGRALLVERLEHVGGKVDHGGLLCRRQAVRGIGGRMCHVPRAPSAVAACRHVSIHMYVEDACAVVNTGGEEACAVFSLLLPPSTNLRTAAPPSCARPPCHPGTPSRYAL